MVCIFAFFAGFAGCVINTKQASAPFASTTDLLIVERNCPVILMSSPPDNCEQKPSPAPSIFIVHLTRLGNTNISLKTSFNRL